MAAAGQAGERGCGRGRGGFWRTAAVVEAEAEALWSTVCYGEGRGVESDTALRAAVSGGGDGRS